MAEALQKLAHEIGEFVNKGWTLICLIVVGIMGKLSYDLVTGKRITAKQAISFAGLAIFVGFVTSIICKYFEVSESLTNAIVPMATLLSEKIMITIFAIDGVKIARKFFADMLSSALSYITNGKRKPD